MSAGAEAVPLMSSGSMMLRQRSTMMPPARRPDLYIDEVTPCIEQRTESITHTEDAMPARGQPYVGVLRFSSGTYF